MVIRTIVRGTILSGHAHPLARASWNGAQSVEQRSSSLTSAATAEESTASTTVSRRTTHVPTLNKRGHQNRSFDQKEGRKHRRYEWSRLRHSQGCPAAS